MKTQSPTAAEIYHEQTGRESHTKTNLPYAAYVAWLEHIAEKAAIFAGIVAWEGNSEKQDYEALRDAFSRNA